MKAQKENVLTKRQWETQETDKWGAQLAVGGVFRSVCSFLLWILVSDSFAPIVTAQTTSNSTNTLSTTPSTSPSPIIKRELLISIACGVPLALGALGLLIYVVFVYNKREHPGSNDAETGRRHHREKNMYELKATRTESNPLQTQTSSASGNSQNEGKDAVSDSKPVSSGARDLYSKPNKVKKYLTQKPTDSVDPLYSKLKRKTEAGSESEEASGKLRSGGDSEISEGKKRATDVEPMYTRPMKKKKNGGSAGLAKEDMYTKPKKVKRHATKGYANAKAITATLGRTEAAPLEEGEGEQTLSGSTEAEAEQEDIYLGEREILKSKCGTGTFVEENELYDSKSKHRKKKH